MKKEIMPGTTEFNGIEVIHLAMEIEKSGHFFYSRIGQGVSPPPLRKLFARLANDEVQHLQSLQKLMTEFQDDAFWENEQEYLPYLKRFKDMEFFPNPEAVEAALTRPDSNLEILDLAISAEKRFSEFFAVAALYARNEEGKTVFSWLTLEEKQHAELLAERKASLFRQKSGVD